MARPVLTYGNATSSWHDVKLIKTPINSETPARNMMTRSRDKIATAAQLGKQAHDRKLKLTRNTKMSKNPKILIFETFFRSAYSSVIFQGGLLTVWGGKGDTTPCSGKGQCICGNCECNSPDITGNQCECDNFDCPRHNGLLCSGPENGDCECGKCVCRNSRTGPTCECGPDWQCVNPDTKEVCSGNGVCSCGACTCYETEAGMYTGAYCQYSPELRKTCDDFKSCVLCDVHKTGDFADYEFCKNCTDRMTIVTEEIVEVQEEGEQLCFITDEYEDEDGCKIRFVYSFNGTMPIIRAEEEKHCLAGDRDALIWGIIAALLVLLIGLLLLLLWKLWTRYKDRRDYAKFEKERESAKWDTYGLNRKELGTRYISYREVSSGKDRNRSDNPKPSYLENMVHQRQ
ncbi:Integrin beta-PS [Nymphon striatum]|nr:Integrin beta-PS [Nymphon striatum]